ncbi:MAG: hypothetical protein HZB11_02715 [Candidatus Yonathbacteria bacterium]|nr:hypothetical protein [Candidatus Yonathbacteria bacterium]
MSKSFFRKFFISSVLSVSFFGIFTIPAAAAGCPESFTGLSKPELEAALLTCEKEIVAQESILTNKQREGVSLERDIAILNAQIEKAKLSIKARNLSIAGLVDDIGVKNRTIVKYSTKINRERESLAGLMRRTYELDTYSIVEVALSDKNFSEFFVDLDNFQYVEDSIGVSLEEVGVAKRATEEEKKILEDKKEEEVDLRRIQELERKLLVANEAEKRRILKETKGQELAYQKVLKEKQKSAAAIRAELFSLSGSKAIPFGLALEYATGASKKTGVRAAVILGILTIESNLGENQGTGTWRADMAQRDWADFQSITSKLGLNPDSVPISARPCGKAERDRIGPGVACGYGWGGAMGPSQFIPSTWLMYEERIAALSGSNPPNPWLPRDAIFATALLLKDNGADKGTRAADRLAALRYLAGWKNAQKKSVAFYGTQVMGYADDYQKQIDILNDK